MPSLVKFHSKTMFFNVNQPSKICVEMFPIDWSVKCSSGCTVFNQSWPHLLCISPANWHIFVASLVKFHSKTMLTKDDQPSKVGTTFLHLNGRWNVRQNPEFSITSENTCRVRQSWLWLSCVFRLDILFRVSFQSTPDHCCRYPKLICSLSETLPLSDSFHCLLKRPQWSFCDVGFPFVVSDHLKV